MATLVVMPRLTDTMHQGKIVEWLKREGESVQEGDPLFVVETDKAAVEVNAAASGILLKIVVAEGEMVDVEGNVAVIGLPGEDISNLLKKDEIRIETENDESSMKLSLLKRTKASPAAKRLAKERGIDINKVVVKDENTMITEKDIETLIKLERKTLINSVFYGEEEKLPLDGVRKAMAKKMSQSAHEMARVTTFAETDVTDLRTLSKEKKITITSFVIRAVVESLVAYPIINSSLSEDKIILKKYYNIGVSVASPRGLIVPVIHNVENLNLPTISEKLKHIAQKARDNQLSLEDVSGGTFTVTNSGVFGALLFTPMINPPESAILGLGKMLDTPAVKNNMIIIRCMMYLSLSYDHRVINGEEAVLFLQKVKSLLEAPDLLLEIK